MFGNRREIRRINELKLRSEAERAQLVTGVRFFRPLAMTAARVGIYALAIKNLAPALKPIALGLIQRGLAKRGKTGLVKLAGIISAGIGIVRACYSRERTTEAAALE